MGKVQARNVSVAERGELREGLKDRNGIVVRRSQAILMSADEKLTPQAIADRLGWNRETHFRQLFFEEFGIKKIGVNADFVRT